MAKYELVEKTEIDGQVWYFIKKDGESVSTTWTQVITDAQKMIEQFEKGKSSEPMFRIIKTIDVDEN